LHPDFILGESRASGPPNAFAILLPTVAKETKKMEKRSDLLSENLGQGMAYNADRLIRTESA
jgi:hypothetical protein